MSRLTVVMASRRLVRIWTENLLFHIFSVPSQKRRDREHLHTIFERKLDLAFRGERENGSAKIL